MTTFYPSGTDGVFVIPDIDKILNGEAEVKIQTVEEDTQWPNMAETSYGTTLLTACGFFVSGAKSTGSIDLYDVSDFPNSPAKRTKISEDRKGNFYHQAVFMDVDADGKDDIIAARAFKSLYNPLSKAEGELMWFKPPSDGNPNWETRYLTTPQGHDGPDVAFTTTDLDNDGKLEIVAAQFFTQQALVVWECTAEKWSDCENGANIKYYTVDNNGDPFFNVQWVDLDMDGTKDLLATTNTASGKGAVYGYRLVADFRRGAEAWEKHTLATGYKPLHPHLPGQGSPGFAYAFQVSETEVPLILVSADDGGWFDLLQRTDAWTYNVTQLVNTTGTVGSQTKPMDIDGSGRKVFFLPLYSEGKVQMYVFD